MLSNDDDEHTENAAREAASRLDDATRVLNDTDADADADDVALFRRAVRFAYLARHLGVRGWEDVEEMPNSYLEARFEHRASTIAREMSPDVLLRVVSETTRDHVVYVPDRHRPLPRLLGSLSEPDTTACATLMLWAVDKKAAANRVSAVENYACERAKRDAVRWAEDTTRREPSGRGRFVTTYGVAAN